MGAEFLIVFDNFRVFFPSSASIVERAISVNTKALTPRLPSASRAKVEDAQAPAAHSCKVVLFVKFLARFSHYFHTKHSRFIACFFLKRVTKGLKRIKNATSRFSARRPLLSALFPWSCQHIRITNCADISLDTKELSEHEKKGQLRSMQGHYHIVLKWMKTRSCLKMH